MVEGREEGDGRRMGNRNVKGKGVREEGKEPGREGGREEGGREGGRGREEGRKKRWREGRVQDEGEQGGMNRWIVEWTRHSQIKRWMDGWLLIG